MAPDNVNCDVLVFWVIPVMLLAIVPLIVVAPAPAPLFRIAPVVFTVELTVTAPAPLVNVRLPVLLMALVLIVNGLAAVCVKFPTFVPMPPLIVIKPVEAPDVVIVPVLLSWAVEIVNNPAAVLLLRVTLPEPVTPPLIVKATAVSPEEIVRSCVFSVIGPVNPAAALLVIVAVPV